MCSILIAAFLGIVVASPVDDSIFARGVDASAGFCSVVNKVITVAKQQTAATAYCSSYLHITATVPTTTVTAHAGVTCVPPTVSGGSKAKRNVLDTGLLEKRVVVAPKPKPSALNSYSNAAIISSACSCLHIPTTAATTVTTTTTITDGPLVTPTAFKVLSEGGPVPGAYAVAVPSNPDLDFLTQFSTTSSGDASIFSINAQNDITYTSQGITYIASADSAGPGDYVYFSTVAYEAELAQYGGQLDTCSVTQRASDGVCVLDCNSDSLSVDIICQAQSYWMLIQPGVSYIGCDAATNGFTPLVVPA